MTTRLFYKKVDGKISHGDHLEGEETIIEALNDHYAIHEYKDSKGNEDCYWSYEEDDGSTTLIAFDKKILKNIK